MMMEDQLAAVRSVKQAHESELLSKANVVGVGIGLDEHDGHSDSEPTIVVSVTHKVPIDELAPEDVVPQELDGIRVSVRAVGKLSSSELE